jgi:hypothetical protein
MHQRTIPRRVEESRSNKISAVIVMHTKRNKQQPYSRALKHSKYFLTKLADTSGARGGFDSENATRWWFAQNI